jgi:hypothetical protein
MNLLLATWLVRVGYVYAAIGVLLLPWFQLKGLRRIDATAGGGPWGFRAMISLGLVLLWPWMLKRALAGRGHPSEERNAHRCGIPSP